MKILPYEMMGNLFCMAFPEKRIDQRRDLLIIMLESCRFMMQNTVVEHADNLLMLVVNDMNRLFFCREKKMYSIAFPFHVECSSGFKLDLEGIDISPSMISNLCTFISSDEYEMQSSFDFFTPIIEIEEQYSKDFWYVLKYLMTYELGYIRYDDDVTGFNIAYKKGEPRRHPRYHFDVNYSRKSAFKIGLDKQLTPNKFIEILDDS